MRPQSFQVRLHQAIRYDAGIGGRKIESLENLSAESIEIGFGYSNRSVIRFAHLNIPYAHR